MSPSLRQLEYLVALARELNFRKAAEATHVSQPGLSTQIQQVERLLGVRLFERDRRHVVATEAGAEAAERAVQILALVDDLVDAVRGFGEPLTGQLHLGVVPSVAPFMLAKVLPTVRARHPNLQLLLREQPTARLVERLAEGSLDLLLLALEAPLGDGFPHPLFKDPFFLAVPVGHRLMNHERVREADLKGEEVLLLEDGH